MAQTDRAALIVDAASRAARYLSEIQERSVAPSPDALAGLRRLAPPLPATGLAAERVLALLDEAGSPATLATAGPRFFGFVIGGSLPATLAAGILAAAWDQNAGLRVTSPAAAALEDAAITWLLDVLALPAGAGVGFVTCATTANQSGLAAARHALLARQGWNVEANGLFGAPPLRVVVGDEVHVSVLKALAMVGLGAERVERVPVDGQGRLRTDALPPLDERTIVCLQAGNVNTGAFDPAADVVARAQRAGAWVHVDGAFGLWARAAASLAPLVAGLEGADFEVWAALLSLGRDGLRDLVERTCGHARRFADALRADGHEVLNDVVLNQVLVGFGPPERTRRVIEEIQAGGVLWCSGTVWQGRTAMRISVSSWATTAADVERSIEAIRAAVARAQDRRPDHPALQ
jgi:aromatic-L-amino-acid decarboxylase